MLSLDLVSTIALHFMAMSSLTAFDSVVSGERVPAPSKQSYFVCVSIPVISRESKVDKVSAGG